MAYRAFRFEWLGKVRRYQRAVSDAVVIIVEMLKKNISRAGSEQMRRAKEA